MMKKNYCSYCGKENSAISSYCVNCGKSLKSNFSFFSAKNISYFFISFIVLFLIAKYYKSEKINEIQLYIANNQFALAQASIEDIINPLLLLNKSEISNLYSSLNEKKYIIKQERQRNNSSNSSSSSNSNSSSNSSSSSNTISSSNNTKCKTFAVIKFHAIQSCIINSSITFNKVDDYANINVNNFYKEVTVSSNCIKGYYKFSWTYYAQCINLGKPDGPYSYSGKVYIDGTKDYYTIYISDLFDLTIEVQ